MIGLEHVYSAPRENWTLVLEPLLEVVTERSQSTSIDTNIAVRRSSSRNSDG